MKVELVEDPELVRMMGYASDQTRTRNVLHLSDIYKRLMIRLQPKRFSAGPFVMNARVEAGILFESILEEAMARKFATVRPGELVSSEGVFMSPDGVNPDLGCGEEYKATWMTSSIQKGESHIFLDSYGSPNEKFYHWFAQMMGYAKHLDTDMFMLRVFFANGNYNRSGVLKGTKVPDPDSGPGFKSYRCWFTKQEIEQNWNMLMNIAKEEGLL